jgi:hypothetical protein
VSESVAIAQILRRWTGWDSSEGRYQGAANMKLVMTRLKVLLSPSRKLRSEYRLLRRLRPPRTKGDAVPAKSQRLALLVVLVMGLLMVSPLAANAATNRLSGTAFYDATQCPGPPAGYEDFTSYPGLVMTGSLQGCLYTKVETTKDTPGGVYLESGEEVFVGSLDGGPLGSFATTYRFESKWDPDVSTGVEVRGRCQHPIVEGRGTGGLEGARGRVDFKDIIGETPLLLSTEVTSASANTVAKM